MAIVVLAFVVFNLALGFGAAYLLAMPMLWDEAPAPARSATRRPVKHDGPATATCSDDNAPAAAADLLQASAVPVDSPAKFALDDLPPQWLEQFAVEGIEPNSLAEATAHVMRLEVGRYREHLVTAENRARGHIADRNGELLIQVASDLRHINEDWLVRQSTAAQTLGQRKDLASVQEEVARDLEQVLCDQAAQIKDANSALETLNGQEEVELGGKRLMEKLGKLIDQAHALRDRIQDLVATLLRSEGRLDSVGNQLQLDRATGLPNRVGLEVLFDGWWKEDPERQRELSVALVDVDHFARINERLGTRAGDRSMAALGQFLANLIRKDRGYDRVARIAGSTYLLFYGDTTAANGLIAAERARQNLEATTWDDQGTEFDFTVSCGVVGVNRADTVPDILRRAWAALRFAKQAGRDRVAVNEGNGPQTHDPPQFPIKGRVVKLEAES